ncbi:hypothetical protein P0D72_41115 [Paraburkholderia sediminicola]|uniref:hypothetical protein n=1 Tax=Paraburkholderia sediminicola TaxID=458836 RepID=UPI0038B752B0
MRLLVIGMIMNLLVSPGVSQAGATASSTEVVIEAGVASNPHSVRIAPDNDIIVVGDNWATRSAWAVRTDREGRTRWRVEIPSEDPERTSASGSEFNSSTILQDGTTVLCGHIGVKRFSTQPAYMLLVDSGGKKLKENRLYPADDDAFRQNDILKCIARNGGIITVGKTIKYRPINVMPRVDYFYWIAFYDVNGRLKWDQKIPINIQRLEKIDSITTTSDGHIVFCAEGADQTEVVSIDSDGMILARISLPGSYLLVQTVAKSEVVQIASRTIGDPWKLITFDSHLHVSQQTVSERKLDSALSAAWMSKEGDYMLTFGEAVRESVPKEATVVKVDMALRTFDVLDVPSLADSSRIDAVGYSAAEDKFVMAHVFRRPHQADSPIGTSLTFLQITGTR